MKCSSLQAVLALFVTFTCRSFHIKFFILILFIQATADETKEWIPPCQSPVPEYDELMAWREWKKEKVHAWFLYCLE